MADNNVFDAIALLDVHDPPVIIEDEQLDDNSDEGIERDSDNHPEEYPSHEKFLEVESFQGHGAAERPRYCTVHAFVVVETPEVELHMCDLCYIEYSRRTPMAKHRHVNSHVTSTYLGMRRGLCSCCQMRLYVICRTDVCLICNNAEKNINIDGR